MSHSKQSAVSSTVSPYVRSSGKDALNSGDLCLINAVTASDATCLIRAPFSELPTPVLLNPRIIIIIIIMLFISPNSHIAANGLSNGQCPNRKAFILDLNVSVR